MFPIVKDQEEKRCVEKEKSCAKTRREPTRAKSIWRRWWRLPVYMYMYIYASALLTDDRQWYPGDDVGRGVFFLRTEIESELNSTLHFSHSGCTTFMAAGWARGNACGDLVEIWFERDTLLV